MKLKDFDELFFVVKLIIDAENLLRDVSMTVFLAKKQLLNLLGEECFKKYVSNDFSKFANKVRKNNVVK